MIQHVHKIALLNDIIYKQKMNSTYDIYLKTMICIVLSNLNQT